MKEQLQKLQTEFLEAVARVAKSEELEALRVDFLGRKGKMAEVMKQIPTLADEAKKEAGAIANQVKTAIESAFTTAQQALSAQEKVARDQSEWLDVTAPGTSPELGHLHLTTQAIREITDIFHRIGFIRVRHPEVDWDYYAFEALNIPKGHPARDEWETFFVAGQEGVLEGEKGKVLLVPHTSNGQVREMEKGHVPIRMLNITKTYRRQSDVSHAPMFHQFEGLMVDKDVSIPNLKGTIDFFVKQFFGADREIRLRPYHFRFTEPSFEIDISCDVCKGTGKLPDGKCRLCKQGWLEIGGSGMVHPNVIKAGGLNPEEYQGFAFGFGVERCMMMKSGVNVRDIRMVYRNDLRFLQQF